TLAYFFRGNKISNGKKCVKMNNSNSINENTYANVILSCYSSVEVLEERLCQFEQLTRKEV
ncbi:MAG: hypothetical protein LBH62_08530, partial [Nitrososphaerota archaeon]|nr:hypothetical protein [Nitrososphaerota archaeon]